MLDNDEFIVRLAQTLGGSNAEWCDNLTSVELSLGHRPLPMRAVSTSISSGQRATVKQDR